MATLEALDLEELLGGEVTCQSQSHRPGYSCTVDVLWCSISTCNGIGVLWCGVRHRQYVEQNLRDHDLCARCRRPISTCWVVNPA